MTFPLLCADLNAAAPIAAPARPFGPVVMRPLASVENAAFAAHLKRLDDRGRRLRFGVPVNDGFIDAYARRQAASGTPIIGLFVAGTLRGVAELCVDPADPAGGEGAFSLERAYRGLGLGTRLFEALLGLARRRGIARLTLQCLRENVAMQRLARRRGAKLSFERSEVTALVEVGPAPVAALAPNVTRILAPLALLAGAGPLSFRAPAG